MFYINLPVGILAIFLAGILIHDPDYIRKAKLRIDYWGLILISLGLGCLQIVLDKGEREAWFESAFILVLTVITVVSLVVFTVVELRSRHPVVNLRVFRDRTFASGCVIMFMGFFSLFGGFVLLPLYAQTLMGYTAVWAGYVLGPGGIASLFIMPVAGVLMRKGVSSRLLLAICGHYLDGSWDYRGGCGPGHLLLDRGCGGRLGSRLHHLRRLGQRW